jgi:hypothetical protein
VDVLARNQRQTAKFPPIAQCGNFLVVPMVQPTGGGVLVRASSLSNDLYAKPSHLRFLKEKYDVEIENSKRNINHFNIILFYFILFIFKRKNITTGEKLKVQGQKNSSLLE